MLSHKRTVITGGSEGIGLGIAKAFAKNGASVVLVARDKENLRAAAATLSPFGVEVKVVSADLSDRLAVRKTAEDILRSWPDIDVLVNNAGTARFTPFTATTETDLDLLLNLNVKAPYLLTQHLFGALEVRKGVVINISSYFSHRMLPGRPSTAYSLSKGAIDAFTKSLASEAGPRGVRVNAIAPGTVNTPLVRVLPTPWADGRDHPPRRGRRGTSSEADDSPDWARWRASPRRNRVGAVSRVLYPLTSGDLRPSCVWSKVGGETSLDACGSATRAIVKRGGRETTGSKGSRCQHTDCSTVSHPCLKGVGFQEPCR